MNPYAKNATKEESKVMWAGLGPLKSTFRYARYLPSFLPGKIKSSIKKVNKYMKSTKKRVNSKVSNIVLLSTTQRFSFAFLRDV